MPCNCGGKNKAAKQAAALQAQEAAEKDRQRIADHNAAVAQQRTASRAERQAALTK